MSGYRIGFKPSVEKDFKRLPRVVVPRVMKCIEGLKDKAIPQGAVKLSGGEHLYRIRVGDYRVVYEVDTRSQQLMIHYIRHRREVYRPLKG